jgi:hypothetical protein
MSENPNPLDALLEQYKERKHLVNVKAKELESSVFQTAFIAKTVTSFTESLVKSLNEQASGGEDTLGLLEKLAKGMTDVNIFITAQPARIEKELLQIKTITEEIAGFENAILKLKSEVIFEPVEDDLDLEDDLEDIPPVEDNDDNLEHSEPVQAKQERERPRAIRTRPETLKSKRNSRKNKSTTKS